MDSLYSGLMHVKALTGDLQQALKHDVFTGLRPGDAGWLAEAQRFALETSNALGGIPAAVYVEEDK